MFCSNCGKPLSNGIKHCNNCGATIEGNTSPTIQAVQFHCNGCNSVMHISSESQVLRCPCCGSTELIVESDAVTIERIKSHTFLETHRSEKAIEREKLHIDEKKDLRKYGWKWKKTLLIILSPAICLAAIALMFRTINLLDSITEEDLSGKVSPPLHYVYCNEEHYSDLVMYFEDAGFTNVEAKSIIGANEDNSTPGQVSKVMINGETSFFPSDKFDPDVKVVIYYFSTDYAEN